MGPRASLDRGKGFGTGEALRRPPYAVVRRMEGWQESLYGARIAAIYDETVFGAPPPESTDEAVAFLVELLAGTGGRLLELGSGTGRLLLPLAANGVSVQGIELS